LSDLENAFTGTASKKFAIKPPLTIPSHLNHVAPLLGDEVKC